ncbi:MAG: archease [Acidobacteriota bacterium]
MNKKYEIFFTTADIGLKVRGKSIEELFKNAAEGMFSIMRKNLKNRSNSIKRKIDVKSYEWESLLAEWLNELLFLYDSKKVIFTNFKINEILPYRIKAEINGYKANKEDILREIKAVTLHNLKIIKEKNIWKTEIIFDI